MLISLEGGHMTKIITISDVSKMHLCSTAQNHWDYKRDTILSGEISLSHPLVELQPGGEALAVLILQAEEPGLPQPDGLYNLNTCLFI